MTSNGGVLRATYRVQLNAEFTLQQARSIVPYLDDLGVSHLYCSPVLAARRGSTHGYDVVDPTRVDPELGDESEFRALAADLHARGMGLLLDIVPNHMSATAENPYWDDVLRHGEGSRWAHWFDVDWAASDGQRHRVVLPLLGDEVDRVIDRGELIVRVAESGTRISYFDKSVPVDPTTLPPELQLAQFDPAATPEALRKFRGAAGRAELRALLDAQHYRLVHWRRGATELNYRRFFDVNDLVALRMEDPRVFEETHALILRWVRDGVVDGLRIDHIDGLQQPRQYLERLRTAMVPARSGAEDHAAPFLFVEKILSPGEHLRAGWPVDGTTGYEFLNDVEDVLISPDGFADVDRGYRRMRRLGASGFAEAARAGKSAVLVDALRPDVERLAKLALPLIDGAERPSEVELMAGVREFVASLAVYRTYIDPPASPDEEDVSVIARATADARERPTAGAPCVPVVADLLLRQRDEGDEPRRRRVVLRLQQLSGPAMAKGVEDNAHYQYIPLASRNEVGGAPDRPLDGAVERLHAANVERAARWPLALLCTDTHDTKRSADLRARLDALSELPREWDRAFRRWRRLNAKHRVTVRGRLVPDTNAEYLLYQTMIGIWPAPRAGRRVDDLPDRSWREATCVRLQQYMRKAVREAALRTTWTDPDRVYEAAVDDFVEAILQPSEDAPFLSDLARFVARVSLIGAWNSLSRLAVQLTAPGTPDIYQGQELFNFALVDPDNRRPVDYALRRASLDALAGADAAKLDLRDPRTKLFVMHRLLSTRRAHAELFARGEYLPLEVRGARAAHVIAYARRLGDQHAVVVASRLVRELVEGTATRMVWWGDTRVVLPPTVGVRQLTSAVGGVFRSDADGLTVGAVLEPLPAALLTTP